MAIQDALYYPHQLELTAGLQIPDAAWNIHAQRFLTPELAQLLTRLHREFEPERKELLNYRKLLQTRYDAGALPEYLPASEATFAPWQVNPIPADLLCRRVEITGPVNSTKMVIQMLSRNADGHRADTAMLDFEDSMKPTWINVTDGLANLIGAAEADLTYTENLPGKPAKRYAINADDLPVVMVRVRGLHLDETNVQIDGAPISGGLFDFVTSFYHTAKLFINRGQTPTFYVPKTEHFQEARWWNKLFTAMERELDIPIGAMKATFLIETLPAAFEMEEILYEIRDHAAGLNVGRWDKIFSDIKILRHHPDRIMADRGTITMKAPWMMNYAKRLIKICHAHGALAIGGMSAFTPGKTPEARKEQTSKVAEDKQLEASMGHDGCWVSHPYFIGHAMAAFTKTNQLDVTLSDFPKQPDMLPVSQGPKTLAGLRKNIRVGIAYFQGWNSGIGCVSWDGLMEDLATLEISRTQVWQWLHHHVTLDDGRRVTNDLVDQLFDEEYERIITEIRDEHPSRPEEAFQARQAEFLKARVDAQRIFTAESFEDYLSWRSEPTA